MINETNLIIKLQALWRGHKARKLVARMKRNALGSSKYFTTAEASETISSNRIWNKSHPREKRPAYLFKSGAKYAGTWRGGFRDGYGE